MNAELNRIIRVMSGNHRMDISRYDESFLLTTLKKREAASCCATIAEYGENLAEDTREAEELYRSLNITYSEFFRNPLTFALLELRVLPTLIEEKISSGSAEIRVWSAGCAAGQEAYSVAILLDELLSARKSGVSYRMFATDISQDALASAMRGVYDATGVGNVRLKQVRSCFAEHNGMYTVDKRLRDRIEFSFYDLLDERSRSPAGSIFGDFDLVFCSNLLFYYTPEIRQVILNKVISALSGGGYLVTGEAERSIVDTKGCWKFCPVSAVYRNENVCRGKE